MSLALAWLGGCALALWLLLEAKAALEPLWAAWKKRRNLRKIAKLDWTLIDNTLHSPRPRRDCEREESLGICTGRECLVYESCDFSIKKVVH